MLKFLYVALLIKLCNAMEFHPISFCGLFIIMGQNPLVWSLWYDPTQQQNLASYNIYKIKYQLITARYRANLNDNVH